MKKIVSIVGLCLSVFATNAQQEAHYTQFMHNNTLINPGFVGARRVPTFTGLYRNQWLGYKGAPASFQASFDMPIGKTRLGMGATFAHQQEGIQKRNFMNLAFNYDILHTEDATLRFGLNGTIRHYRYDVQDPSVIIEDATDDMVNMPNTNLYNGNIGAGVYFDNKTYYVGLSVPKLINNSIGLKQTGQVTAADDEFRHLYIQAGGFFKLNALFHLKPALNIKITGNSPFSVDANLGVMYNRKVLVGVSYRLGNSIYGGNDAAAIQTLFQVTDNLAIGAAYDFTMSEIRKVSNGSIEFLVRYDLLNGNQKIKNPRFFF